jgi:uncharacterized protein (DUF362 family)
MESVARARVALSQGASRQAAVSAALKLVEDGINLRGVQHVLIKPNFVTTQRQLAATHVDAVRAVLDLVRSRYDGKLTIGEGPAASPASAGFDEYGYRDVALEYGADLVDLNAGATVPIRVYSRHLRPMTLHLARTVVDADYRISIGPPKTHDTVVVTLAIKNLVMGALANPGAPNEDGRGLRISDTMIHLVPVWLQHSRLAEEAKRFIARPPRGSSKMAMHQSIPVINLNLALIASAIWPQLAVIDGWQGMEGAGPAEGDPVDWRIALAGTDPLAVDVLTTHLMGFDPTEVGYLQHCRSLGLGVGALSSIDVVGDVEMADVARSFVPHPALGRQFAWRQRGIEQRLQLSCVS